MVLRLDANLRDSHAQPSKIGRRSWSSAIPRIPVPDGRFPFVRSPASVVLRDGSGRTTITLAFSAWSNTDRTILLETSSLQSRCRDLNSYRYEHPGCMAPRLARLELECLTDTILLAADFIRRLPCDFSVDKGTVSLGKDPPQGTQLEIKLFSKKRPRAEQPKSNTPYLVCFQASYRAMFSSFGG